jgi:hypothetical protein
MSNVGLFCWDWVKPLLCVVDVGYNLIDNVGIVLVVKLSIVWCSVVFRFFVLAW